MDKEQYPESDLTEKIIAAAIEVHKALGPGLLESAYEECLFYELRQRDVEVARQVSMPVIYKGVEMDCGYRVDLVVRGKVIVELKAVREFEEIHMAQVITYLKLSGCRIGLLMNFNVKRLTDGIRRLIV